MDKSYIQKLEKQREKARINLAKAQRELEVLDQILNDAHKANNTRYTPKELPKTKRSYDYNYYREKILDALNNNPDGLLTNQIYDIVRATSNSPPKYTTFRSYLSRLKKKKDIYQERRVWKHIYTKKRKYIAD